MIKLSLMSILFFSVSTFSLAESLEATTTEAFYSEKPMVYVSPEDRIKTLVFTTHSSTISDNVSLVTVKRDKEKDTPYMYQSKYVYCLVEKDIKSIYAESSIKKTCINEFGEGTDQIVNDTKLDLAKVIYLEYPIPAGKKLDYFAVDPIELGKPNLNYVDLGPNEKPKAYLIYGFIPTSGELKQNIIYIFK
jgi:hypothetical protein